jgi:hypothetical protein
METKFKKKHFLRWKTLPKMILKEMRRITQEYLKPKEEG